MKKAHHKSKEISGIVVRYTTNKHNDIDGLVIDDEGTTIEIRFPPHTAKFIREVAKEKDLVNLKVHEKPHPPHKEHSPLKGRMHLDSIQNEKTQQQFNVASVEPPHPPEIGKIVSFSIPNPKFTRGGKHDEITGVCFEDKFIHLHPEEYDADPDEILAATRLNVKAKQRTTNAGFENVDGHIVYHAQVVEIGKK